MNIDNTKLYDAHTHLKTEKEIEDYFSSNIMGVASVGTALEYKMLSEIKNENLLISTGVHPWTANNDELLKLMPFMKISKIIGEIGLDNEWTDNDIKNQISVFKKQLEYAQKNNKPVILHTKGMEKEVLDIIKNYDNKYLIHWYSTEKYVQNYIDRGYYFTIGPSVLWDDNVMNLAKKVPIDRVLVETDGIDAVKWAYDNYCDSKDITYRKTLINSINKISKIKNISAELLAKIIETNFKRFFEV